MGEIAGVVVALGRQAELAEDAVGLAGDGVVEMGERAQMRGLALAREDRQRHVVEGGEIVEYVDQLEAAGDAGLHALRHGRPRDVLAPEEDLARLGRQQRADDIDERGLAGAVGADKRDELALLDAQVDVVDGARLAEIALEVDGLQESHVSALLSLAARRASVPTMPVGSTITRTTSTQPEHQLPVLRARDRIDLEVVERRSRRRWGR